MAQRKAHVIDDRERTLDIEIEENVDFRSMYLSDPVLSGLKASGFERPSPIQLAAIPLGRCGLDMVVQAKSGTGKTCVFAVVALEMVSVSATTTQVLVLTPTREIAVQVAQVISAIGIKIQGLQISTFIGGMNLTIDKAKLKCCHIAVGTPGRITQLIEMGLLRLDNVRLFVLDEADQLLTGQFADSIANIASGLPLNKQVLALSATYTEDVAKVAEGLMRSPNHVRLGKDSPALIGVDQFVKVLPYHHQPHRRQQTKFVELVSILSTVTFNQCLVFSNSQLRAESVCNKLRANGWPVAFLTGGQAQQDRLVALDALCSYKCRVLVSTDLSARGLDSEHVNLVINLDLPRDHATYLHRIGRAGRFGSRGSSITLVTEGEEWQVMRAIASLANVRIALIKGDLTSDITNREEESQEFVEFLCDDEFTDYLHNSNFYENDVCKKGKSKHVETKTNGTTLSSDSYVEKSKSKKKHNRSKSKVKERIKLAQESSQKDLESEKLAERNKEEQQQNLSNVMTMLKRLNVKHSIPSVSFEEIKSQISGRYDNISADDNPLVSIPPLPNAFEISSTEQRDLVSHWKYIDKDLQEVILNSNDSWKDFMTSVENALQSRIEGERNPFKKMDKKGENNYIDSKDKSEASCNSGSEKYSDSVQRNPVSPKESVKSKSGSTGIKEVALAERNPQKKISKVYKNEYLDESETPSTDSSETYSYSKHKQPYISRNPCKESVRNKKGRTAGNIKAAAQRETGSYKKPHRTGRRENITENYHHYYGYDPYLYYGMYSNEEGNGCHSSSGITTCSDDEVEDRSSSTRSSSFRNVLDPSFSYGNSFSYAYGVPQKYIDSIEKFSAMMDYVQTMGRMSSWIARDYHFGS